MKSFTTAMIAMVAPVLANQVFKTPTDVTKKSNGAIVQTFDLDGEIEKMIHFPMEKYATDYTQQADMMNKMADWHVDYKKRLENNEVSDEHEPIYTCGDRDPFGTA